MLSSLFDFPAPPVRRPAAGGAVKLLQTAVMRQSAGAEALPLAPAASPNHGSSRAMKTLSPSSTQGLLSEVQFSSLSSQLLNPGGEPQHRTNDREGGEGGVLENVESASAIDTADAGVGEILDKRICDVIQGEPSNRRPKSVRQRLPNARNGKKRENVGEDRRRAEDDE